MEAFRDATIDKWDGKVKAGAGAAPASKFKALNQSVLSQVQTVLQDSARLIRRTRVKRSSYRVLGAALFASPENKGSSAVAELYGDGAGGRGDDEPAAEGGKSARGLQEEDSEAYDDADFYQLLLRDLIESAASAEDATELQAQLRAARRRVGKAGKNVDTKASKGRKLRFDIQPKLVNFMFPETRERPAFMEALLDNIFKA
jgi:protein AATF/BFR2